MKPPRDRFHERKPLAPIARRFEKGPTEADADIVDWAGVGERQNGLALSSMQLEPALALETLDVDRELERVLFWGLQFRDSRA